MRDRRFRRERDNTEARSSRRRHEGCHAEAAGTAPRAVGEVERRIDETPVDPQGVSSTRRPTSPYAGLRPACQQAVHQPVCWQPGSFSVSSPVLRAFVLNPLTSSSRPNTTTAPPTQHQQRAAGKPTGLWDQVYSTNLRREGPEVSEGTGSNGGTKFSKTTRRERAAFSNGAAPRVRP